MGCWNGTCMISNLPIISGEKIKLVLLSGGFDLDDIIPNSGFCYSDGLLVPNFLPIEGEYNDYGMIEEINEDWNFHFITHLLKKSFTKIKADGKEIIDFSLEDVLEGIERGSFEVIKNNENSFVKSDLAFVMIRKDVWDGLCDKHVGEFWNDNKKETEKGVYNISAKEYCKRKSEATLFHIAELKKIRATGDVKKEIMYDMRTLRETCIFREDRIIRFNNFAYAIALQADNADTNNMIKDWTELVIINSFLAHTRKAWMIKCGAGSQSTNWESYKILNEIVDTICDKHINDDDEEDDEYEEDEED